jgi:hypothetical protein
MKVEEFVDKIEDMVYQLTPDIDSLEEIMVLIADELEKRYAEDRQSEEN